MNIKDVGGINCHCSDTSVKGIVRLLCVYCPCIVRVLCVIYKRDWAEFDKNLQKMPTFNLKLGGIRVKYVKNR